MDINTLAAWGAFVGGLSVVFSLVYLASQIRQNARLFEPILECHPLTAEDSNGG